MTIPLSTRNCRDASTERRTEGIRSSAVGWSSERAFITSAGVLLGSICLAVGDERGVVLRELGLALGEQLGQGMLDQLLVPELRQEVLGADGIAAVRARLEVGFEPGGEALDGRDRPASLAASNSFEQARVARRPHPWPRSATEPLKKPTDPLAMRIARSVNSFGGFLTFARAAANTPGTARSRAMTERSRSAAGAKSRLMSPSIAPPGA